MLERDSREKGDQTLSEEPQSESAPVRGKREAHRPAADEAPGLRAPARPEQPFEADDDLEPQEHGGSGEARKSWLRRHPIAVALGLLCLLLALPAGYLYWDYTSHFETTDDAYIAARQFAIALEVSGYITAVPVTDNEHVAAGAVIARIDDRPYRAALAQAEAQMAAAQANIENINAQMSVQQAQIAADQAQLAQQQAALVFAQQQATRYQYLAKTQLAGKCPERPAIHLAAEPAAGRS
jgi:membrane fusion protein, multidrug efflux system